MDSGRDCLSSSRQPAPVPELLQVGSLALATPERQGSKASLPITDPAQFTGTSVRPMDHTDDRFPKLTTRLLGEHDAANAHLTDFHGTGCDNV